jgi:uncharacterized protein (DUF1330 family)
MPAYILAEVAIHDATIYEEYKKRTPEILEAFEGKFLLRGLPVHALEGNWDHDRLVLLEFPTREKALAWYLLPNTKRRRESEIRLPTLDFC